MSGTIERSKPIEVIMTAEQWQIVMQLISMNQYVGNQLIDTIQRQCVSHVQQEPVS